MPTDIDAKSGDSLMLNCKGIGKPQPEITWTKAVGEYIKKD